MCDFLARKALVLQTMTCRIGGVVDVVIVVGKC
jgi:hypothetical protein